MDYKKFFENHLFIQNKCEDIIYAYKQVYNYIDGYSFLYFTYDEEENNLDFFIYVDRNRMGEYDVTCFGATFNMLNMDRDQLEEYYRKEKKVAEEKYKKERELEKRKEIKEKELRKKQREVDEFKMYQKLLKKYGNKK